MKTASMNRTKTLWQNPDPSRRSRVPFPGFSPRIRPFFLACTGFFLLSPAIGQDFTNIGKRKAFHLSGSLDLQGSSRFSDWNEMQDPFSYSISLRLNPSIYGISLPFSFHFADSRFSFTQPLSQLSFSPSYKWVQLHLGRTSMEMHPYGLSGHPFDGAGITLSPDFPLHFSAMYGRLEKARQGDTALLASPHGYAESNLPSYKRTAYAFKVDFNHKGQQFALHFFRASDHAKSLAPAFQSYASPQANAVWALDFSFKLYKDLRLSGQAGLSSHTSNLLEAKEKKRGILAGIMRPFLAQRASTSLHTAYKIGLGFKGFSLAYERISPGYETLGAYYFNRDFENVVLSFARNFNKWDVKADIGWQRDDLSKEKASRMDRLVGSAYLNYQIDERFRISASYSNFTTYTRLKPIDLTRPDEPWLQDPDTMAFRQIAQQAQFGFAFNTSSQALHPQQAGIDISYQSSREQSQQTFNDYIYASLQHGILIAGEYQLQSALNFSTGIDRTAAGPASTNYSLGPSVVVSKSFFKKSLRTSGGLNYYWDMQGKQNQGSVAGLRLRGSYTLQKVHVFDLQIHTRLRFSSSGTGIGKELHIVAGYHYNFELDPQKLKKQSALRKKQKAARKRERMRRRGEIWEAPIGPSW